MTKTDQPTGSWRAFFDDDSSRDCEVYEFAEDLGVDDCANPATWLLEDGSGDNVALCTTHKDAARAAGIIR